MSTGQGPEDGPATEEELRAAYEAEVKRIRVEQILLENVVTMINLGMRRTGQAAGTEDERDLGQVRMAIDAVRALLPLVDQAAGPQAGPIRDALSRLQMDYVRLGGSPTGAPVGPGQPGPGEPPAAGQAADTPAGGQPGGHPSAGQPGAPPPPAPGSGPPASPSEPGKPGEPGPAQRSGRLWIPGQ